MLELENSLGIIISSLLVGNIAAITLSVSGFQNMHTLAEKVAETNKKHNFENKRKMPFTIQFHILEFTYTIIALFTISEISIIAFAGKEMFLFNWIPQSCMEYCPTIGLSCFFIGVSITIILYTILCYLGKYSGKSKNNEGIETIEDAIRNP